MPRPSGQSQPVARVPDRPTPSLPAWPAVLLVVAVVAAYLPALPGEFLWDDAGHVTRPDLRSLGGLFRIWFEFGATQQYYPVLHSAFWLEHQLWGDSALAYHLLNVALHAAAACLFGRLLVRLAVPGAWFAAALFALHPVGVESVAWISEQKNTLSAVFYLAAALAYLRFDERRTGAAWAAASGWFALALLTKTVTASLPAALLVVFWWKRGRIEGRRDVLPLLPWFVLGAASGLVTAHFERTLIGAQGAGFELGWIERGLLAGRVVWFYLGKLAWPADLAFIYPRWTIDAGVWWQWLFPVATAGGLAALWMLRHRSRAPLAVALLFGGTLFPVLGFFNVFPFAFSFVADHFQYLASLAVFAGIAAGAARLAAAQPRWRSLAAATLLLAGLGGLTWSQSGIYRNVFTLYEDTLAKNPDCWMAHHNLAVALAEAGRPREAIPHLERVLRLKPDYAPAENNLGDDWLQLDQPARALPHLQRAVQLQPDYATAHCNLGLALARLDRTAEAVKHFAEALRLNPDYGEAALNLGLGLMLTGRFPEAAPHLERAAQLNSGSPDTCYLVGRAFATQGMHEKAVGYLRAAVALAPDFAEAHADLGRSLRQLGREAEAQEHFRAARR